MGEALGSGVKTLCSDRAGACAFLPPEQVIADPGCPEEIAKRVTMLREKKELAPFEPKGAGVEDLVALVEAVLARKKAAEGAA